MMNGKWFCVLNYEHGFYHYFEVNKTRSMCSRYRALEVDMTDSIDDPSGAIRCHECSEKKGW